MNDEHLLSKQEGLHRSRSERKVSLVGVGVACSHPIYLGGSGALPRECNTDMPSSSSSQFQSKRVRSQREFKHARSASFGY